MAGRIIIDLFVSLDGVAQAPGAPDEDRSGGFPHGGWQAPVMGEIEGREITRGIDEMDALVLGRRTYDIFAGYWPHHVEGDGAGRIGRKFASIPKYVASRGAPVLEWEGSTHLGADAVAAVQALRDVHEQIHVVGSVDFVQSLLAADAYDELRLYTYPVVIGRGKKVFPEGAAPATLALLGDPVVSEKGAVLLRYGPAGPLRTGTMDD
ncbi:dihydrofolate reductase family protein [Microbacterium invictum]|uniref:Dihydrofolate reductase family protein n=1 Tax=Microbacterium invictum TaxID=515415 RepID=A0ABZ0VA56_9MICO|nr:dihydrofolate reductase family protein [Microbacterium invictum]WQB70221.1 dihydrofolate reductase family protein [Microbacterium invictum]